MPKGTVYLYFDSKEQLLCDQGACYAEDLIQRSGDLLQGDGARSLIDQFDRFLEEMIGLNLAKRELHHVLLHEKAASEAEVMQRLRELTMEAVEKGVKSGELESIGIEFTADFPLRELYGAPVPVLRERNLDRNRFLIPARESARKVLGARTG